MLYILRAFVKIVLGAVTLCYIACVILMYSSPAARELIIYLHPCKLSLLL